MSKWNIFAVLGGIVAATLLPAGCRDAVTPERRGPDVPALSHGGPHGDITIATATEGDAPARYTFSASGPGGTASDTIGANSTRTFPQVVTGDYTVELGDVPTNCTVSGANPRTVTVDAGGGSTTFEVTCTATVRITGLGAVGTSSSATPGSDRKEFDFEATDTPGGRLVYRDWSFVRTDGSVPTITVDPTTDGATGITSFVQTTAACVVFGGRLRVSDTREVFDFTIEACDNGSPGAGSDRFTITVPTAPYMVSGTLFDGDIVLSTGEPAAATKLVFTIQPSNTTAGAVITPAVKVTAQDATGNTATGFTGTVTVAIGTNPGGGTLAGTKTATPVDGVATFADLSIDRAGTGYTLVATANGLTSATSAPFNIIAPPQARVQASGGGRIDPTIGKTTFGFNVDARSGPPFQGHVTVVYHGGTSRMTRIHSVVIDGLTTSPDPRGGVCVTWTGSARVNNGDQRRFTATVCDNGQPGSSPGKGPDRFGITVDGSVSTGLTSLTGGNSQVRQ